MENKNQLASVGLRRIFNSQILMIVAVVLAAIMGIMSLSGSSGAIVIIVGIIAFIALAASFILNLMGLVKAAPAHSYFKLALFFTIVSIIMNIIQVIPAFKNGNVATSVIQTVSDSVMIILVCVGAIQLLKACKEEGTAKIGTIIIALCVICCVIFEICEIFSFSSTGTTAMVLLIAVMVCEVLSKILYLVFIGKASSALAKHTAIEE